MLFSFHNNKTVGDVSKSNIHFSSMFLLWEMCFIQNHLFNSSRFCAGYVCEAKQTSLLWRSERGCQSVTIRETTANKVTKHVVPAFLHSLSGEGSEMVLNIVFIGLPKYFSVLHLWNELYWQPVSPLFVIVFEIFSVSK